MVTIGGVEIGNEKFPNNEGIYRETSQGIIVEFKYEGDEDIFKLIMAKKYIDDKYRGQKSTLIMKYVPYSRMDRKIDGYMFSLKYFCQLINSLNFSKVYVLDPHSNVTTALLNSCDEIGIQYNIDRIFDYCDIDYVFYPDNGACKRYSEILKLPVPYFYGNKKRNLQTGEIVSYDLVDCPDIKGKNILIIDDLCATGFTFYNASKKLKEQGADNIYLYVSHCENSIYKGMLLDGKVVEKIFTTDSILSNWSSDIIVDVEGLD